MGESEKGRAPWASGRRCGRDGDRRLVRLAHPEQHQKRRRGQGRQDEDAHQPHLLPGYPGAGAVGMGGGVQQARQHKHGQKPGGAGDMVKGLGAGAAMIEAAHLSHPGGEGDLHQGQAQKIEAQPSPQPECAGAHAEPAGLEHGGGRQKKQGRASGDPGLAPPKSRPGRVGQAPDQRVEAKIDQAGGHKDRADCAQSQTQVLSIIGRQIDRQRQGDAGQGNRQGAQGQKLGV